MVRPKHCRRVALVPGSNYFKPRGIPLSVLEEVVLTVDEFEAIRLADLERVYQEEASQQMNVSRQTFGRIVDSAHRKVAEALVNGKALKIDGGEFEVSSMKTFRCDACKHSWELPFGSDKPQGCPFCKSGPIVRAGGTDRGSAGASGKGRGSCCRGKPEKASRRNEIEEERSLS